MFYEFILGTRDTITDYISEKFGFFVKNFSIISADFSPYRLFDMHTHEIVSIVHNYGNVGIDVKQIIELIETGCRGSLVIKDNVIESLSKYINFNEISKTENDKLEKILNTEDLKYKRERSFTIKLNGGTLSSQEIFYVKDLHKNGAMELMNKFKRPWFIMKSEEEYGVYETIDFEEYTQTVNLFKRSNKID